MLAEEFGPSANSSGALGDRKLTLTINLESTQGWVRSEALLDSTNSTTWSAIPYTPGVTPSTGRTFGPPTRAPQSMQPPLAKRLSPSVKRDLKTRRLHRYSQAENALKKSMANLSETPPQELQIKILKQVAAALNAHAEEARANTHKLRALLSEGQVAPGEYEQLKRQRWLEEKRQFTADQESKLLQDELELLTKGLCNKDVAKIHEERRQANLFRFLASSTTRRPLQMRPMPRTTQTHRSTASETITTRLRLPQSIIDYLQSRPRVKSLETITTTIPAYKPTHIRDSVAMTFGVQRHVTPPTREDSPVSASPATVSSSHSFSFSPSTESTMTAPNTAYFVADEESDQWDTLEGRAIIYKRYSLYRPKNEILAGMSHVTLPRYARDLIHEFEEEPFDFHPGFSSRKHSISSDWELLTGEAVTSTGHDQSPRPQLVEATTPTKSKHAVLQKSRPRHRSAVSLVALSDSSLQLRETEDKQRLTRKLSLGLFSGRRPSTTDHEPAVAATTAKGHVDLLSFPSSPPINEEEEINEPVSPSLGRPQRNIRNRLSLVFSRASMTAISASATPMASAESLHSVLRATSPTEPGAPAYTSLTLREKVRRKLPFSKH